MKMNTRKLRREQRRDPERFVMMIMIGFISVLLATSVFKIAALETIFWLK